MKKNIKGISELPLKGCYIGLSEKGKDLDFYELQKWAKGRFTNDNKILIQNSKQVLCRIDLDDYNTALEADDNAKLICEAVNNYQSLKESNEALKENLARIIDRIEESNLQGHFPSAFFRAKQALGKAKNI